jgi:2-polyprenyl-3-methyl-5-hydroxy-6-metoxy-1,4-benzoquinol methylase
MRYIYNQKSLPPIDSGRRRSLDESAGRLVKKIEAVSAQQLPLSAYGRETLEDFRTKAAETIKKYVHTLAWLLYPELPGGHQSFVDYGGGHGLLSCLAREAGFPRVIYNDIFDQCCKDARMLAQHLGCAADEYICGNIHTVHESLKTSRPGSCALASINVIEHIYDMDDFIKIAASLSSGPMTMVLSTSANPLNPIVRRRHFRQHREWEFEDGPHEGSYPMDTVKAFLSVRREIVRQCAPQLSGAEVEQLAAATRGMRKDDIESCVRQFEKTKVMPAGPDHPTNTCDPLTGSWQERLLDIRAVSQTLEASGFAVKVLGGYYGGMSSNSTGRAAKKAAAYFLNHGISLLGRQGVRLAPCFMFHAARR